jgi:hypothetical protein
MPVIQLCGRLRSGGSWFQDNPHEKIHELPSQRKKLGDVLHAYHTSYLGISSRRIVVQADPGKNLKLQLKKNHNKKD